MPGGWSTVRNSCGGWLARGAQYAAIPSVFPVSGRFSGVAKSHWIDSQIRSRIRYISVSSGMSASVLIDRVSEQIGIFAGGVVVASQHLGADKALRSEEHVRPEICFAGFRLQ